MIFPRLLMQKWLLFCAVLMTQAAWGADLEPMTVTAPRTPSYAVTETRTATRTDTASLNVPFSVGTVNQSLLQDAQLLRLEEIAPFISGVQASSANSGFDSDLRIRGFSTGGNHYLDGLQDNQHFEVRDTALIDKVEVLKGQSSVLYGSGSPAGAVNFISKKPQAEARHSLSYQTGSYELHRGVLDSTGALTADKSLLYRLIAAGQLANDWRANVTHNSVTVAPSLTWHYAPESSLNLAFEYRNQNQPYLFDTVYTQNQVLYDHSYVDPRARSNRQYWRVSGSVSQKLTDNWSLHFASHYFHVERQDLLFGFFTLVSPTRLSGYYRDIHDHYDQYSLRAELRGQFELFGSQHHVVSGVERHYNNDLFHSRESINGYRLDVYNPRFDYPVPSTKRSDKTQKQTEFGFYLNDTLDITRYLHLTGGFRYSFFNGNGSKNDVYAPMTDQNALVFNAGLSVTPVDNAAIYASYSQSFQPNAGMDKNHTFLPAKQGELYEVGIKATGFQKRLLSSVAVYQLKQSNLTSRDANHPDYFVANGAIRARGFEWDGNAQIGDDLQLLANYSYTDTTFLHHASYQGNSFRSTPRHSGTVWGHYQLPIENLKIGGGLIMVGSRWGDDANSFKVASYIRADAIAHYHLAPFDFRFKVENLLDKRYVSNSQFADTVVQGNRRTALFLINVAF